MTEENFQRQINKMDEPDFSHVDIEDLKLLTHEQIMKFNPVNETTERLKAFVYWLCTDYKGPVPKTIRQELNSRK